MENRFRSGQRQGKRGPERLQGQHPHPQQEHRQRQGSQASPWAPHPSVPKGYGAPGCGGSAGWSASLCSASAAGTCHRPAGGTVPVRRGWECRAGGASHQPQPLTGAFSESSSSSLVKRLKQSCRETFPPAKLFCRGRGSGGGWPWELRAGRGALPHAYLWDGQGEIAEDLEGGGAVAARLALQATLQLPHEEVWGRRGV